MGLRLVFVLFLSLALAARESYNDQNFPKVDPNRFIVKFAGDAESGKSALQKLGGKILRDLSYINAAAVALSPSVLQQLENSTFIKYIESDVPRWPMSNMKTKADSQVVPYGITMVQGDTLSEGSDESWVCIVDSGFDAAHEDLQGMPGLTGGPSGWNTDNCGHGTHVAGTIAARDNTIGVVGVSNSVLLSIWKVFGDDCAWSYSSDLIDAVKNCVGDRHQVTVSMSLGCSSAVDRLCRSDTEDQFFASLFSAGHISVAAAGNAGNSQNSYPASYASVISVAAVDVNGQQASFSQTNQFVEISAPGVNVESTYPMGHGEATTFTVNGVAKTAEALDGSPYGSATGPIVNCGQGTSDCTGAANAICLIERGNNSFSDKVLNCQRGGGVGAIIYNNVPGMFLGTLNGIGTSIPSASLSQADGQAIAAGSTGSLSVVVSNYAFLDGTSMATPHVSGIIAKVWSHNKGWTNQQLRNAMQTTAIPGVGQVGRDNKYGYGIIQGQALLDKLINSS